MLFLLLSLSVPVMLEYLLVVGVLGVVVALVAVAPAAGAGAGGNNNNKNGYNPKYQDDPAYPSDGYDTEFDPELDGDDLSPQAERVKKQAAKKARLSLKKEKRALEAEYNADPPVDQNTLPPAVDEPLVYDTDSDLEMQK